MGGQKVNKESFLVKKFPGTFSFFYENKKNPLVI